MLQTKCNMKIKSNLLAHCLQFNVVGIAVLVVWVPVVNCHYALKNSEGKCLDVQGGRLGNKAAVHLFKCIQTNMNQKWVFKPALSSKFLLQARHSAKCIEGDKSSVSQRNCTRSRTEQFWSAIPSKNADRGGCMSFKNYVTGKCLSASKDGNSISQVNCKTDDDSQLFAWGSTNEIRSYNFKQKCIDVLRVNQSEAAVVGLYTCKPGARNQQWEKLGIVAFQMQAGHSLKCLDSFGNRKIGSRLVQFNCNPHENQLWIKYEYPQDSWSTFRYWRNIGSGLCLALDPVPLPPPMRSSGLMQTNCVRNAKGLGFAVLVP